MSFEWPLDKLSIINAALAFTGDNQVAVADDGSDEWNTCSPAYEDALPGMIETHPWSWATDVRILQPAVTAPDDDQFDTAYPLPADLVHLIWVRISDRPCDWQILGGQLVCNAQGGPPAPTPPQTPGVVTIKGAFATNSDPTFATPLFVSALKRFVMAGIYRGLHEDVATATAVTAEAHQILAAAKTRHDQQMPKRALFNSRLVASRRVRRPYPSTPPGWGGTGIPS